MSWPLAVTLYVRDVLKLAATAPFFIPPLVPAVPEHIPVTGPDLDPVLADEWTAWFSDVLACRFDIPRGAPIDYFSLDERAQGFREVAEKYFAAATAAANSAFEQYFHAMTGDNGAAVGMTHLVRSLEKELGHRAAPFELNVRILPVEGFWLHRAGPSLILMSQGARMEPGQLRRLLGPVIKELA